VPAPQPEQLGPLAGLVGTWEGDQGIDISFHHVEGDVGETHYRERVTFNPFGPVENGTQTLFGLDYRMAAWREGEEDPFHTELGYWLWDATDSQVLRCFMIPRGTVVIAGGPATADAKSFTLTADCGSETYGILSNRYLAEQSRTTHYEVTINIGDDTWSYQENSVIDVKRFGSLLEHTDLNTLHRVAD
jgi:hypothetical protein